MSKLEDLIAELCPNGVEYKKIGDIAFISTGSKLSDIQESPSLYEYINAGTTNSGYSLDWNCDGDVVTTPSRGQGGIGYIGYQKNKFWLGPLCYKIVGNDSFVLNKYLYYYSSNNSYEILSLKKDGGIPAINKSDLEELILPVPPLEVQAEIVRILDTFTELTTELTENLTAELTARKKQYEYYRDALLTFDDNNPLHSLISRYCPTGVEYKALEEVASYPKNRIDSQNLDENNYVGVENLLQNKQGKTRANSIPKESKAICFSIGDVLIGNIRPYLKKIWFADCVGGTNGDVLVIHIHDKNVISPRFLYHILSSERFFLYDVRNSKGAKMPRGDKKAVMQFGIPVPPLEVQRQIVQILDRFDALCNDLTQGLPAEIEARCKQYEYYRNQLLTFKRA